MKAKCGNEKSSDAVVTVNLEAVGREIKIKSKLIKMFGKSMENAVIEALDELGQENAHIVVEDFGALDFIIKGRTKTAIKRARKAGGNL